MALSVVQSKIATEAASTTIAIAFDSNPTEGNAIVVGFVCQSGTITSVADSQSNSYTDYISDVAPSTMRMGVHYSTAITGGANTVTLTVGSSSKLIMAIYEVEGMAASPEDVYVWAEDSGYENTSTSGTTAATAQDNEIVFGIIAGSKAPTYGMSGYTFLEAVETISLCMGYKIVSSTGTQSAAWTHYAEYQQVGDWVFAMKEASAGTNCQMNISDSWATVDAFQINIGDTWKAVEGVQINIGDAWKTIY